mmetsp:Transcript_71012/g.197257  ORF Transcript_71012/g.197257 Transcript_71012/m.197257 type:complete len:239 (+) Transcript_71012:63-779(+)
MMWRAKTPASMPGLWRRVQASHPVALQLRETAPPKLMRPPVVPLLSAAGVGLVMTGCGGLLCSDSKNDLDLTVTCKVCQTPLVKIHASAKDDYQCDECWATSLPTVHSCRNPCCRSITTTPAAMSRTVIGIFSSCVATGYDLCSTCHEKKQMTKYEKSWMLEYAADTVPQNDKETEALEKARQLDGKEIVIKNPYDPFLWYRGYKKMRFVLKGAGPQVEVHYWQHCTSGEKSFFRIVR